MSNLDDIVDCLMEGYDCMVKGDTLGMKAWVRVGSVIMTGELERNEINEDELCSRTDQDRRDLFPVQWYHYN